MGAHRGEVITVRPGAPSSFPLTHTPSFLSPLPQSVGAPELRKRSGAEAAPDKLETSPSQTGCGLRTGWGSWGGAGAGRGEGLRGNEQSSLRPGPQYRPSALQTPVPVLPRAQLSSCHHELQKDHGGRGGGCSSLNLSEPRIACPSTPCDSPVTCKCLQGPPGRKTSKTNPLPALHLPPPMPPLQDPISHDPKWTKS